MHAQGEGIGHLPPMTSNGVPNLGLPSNVSTSSMHCSSREYLWRPCGLSLIKAYVNHTRDLLLEHSCIQLPEWIRGLATESMFSLVDCVPSYWAGHGLLALKEEDSADDWYCALVS